MEVLAEQCDENGNREEWFIETDVRDWQSGMNINISVTLPKISGEIYLSARRKKDLMPILFANQGMQNEKILLGHIIKDKESEC